MRRALCTLAALAGAASSSSATWSIVLIDTRTGEIAVGSATCLTNFDLRAGTPVLIPGIGAATAQSSVDQGGFNRVFIRDRLLEGVEPNDILTMLEGVDNAHQTRQYGIADTLGGTATFTGDRAGQWAGGVTGQVGDVVYAVQGNVLAGDPVVGEAEQVIISSLSGGLDLAETMMLAMEEARSFGGDGRCSCSNNDPDGCGSPPDGWDTETGKSAHIAYMLIARDGDGFGCNSVYKTGRAAWGVATGDFNNDGTIDAAVTARTDSLVSVMLNSSRSPHYVTLDAPIPAFVVSAPTGIVAVDFDKDGNLDLAYTEPGLAKLGLCYGSGDGAFSFPALSSVQDGATWVASGDFNGDSWPDAAVSNLDAGTVSILLNDGAGGFGPASHVAAGIAPGKIIAAEIDGAPGLDLACTDQDDKGLLILVNDGAGSFSLWQKLDTLSAPSGIAAGDFDNDGRTDLATADRVGKKVSVFRQTSPGAFLTARLGSDASYTALDTADLNTDGIDDLVAVSDSPRRLTVLLGRDGDDPEVEGFYTTSSPSNDLALADFNGDGFPDALHNIRQSNGAIVVTGADPALGQGYFNNGEGCATAHYYMEFNVAFQTSNSPDPVAQLHDLYDAWRADLLGITDAVRTTADLGTDRLPVGAATSVLIEPLDWQYTPVGPGLTINAVHAEGSEGLTTLGAAVDHADGTYTIEISAADLPPDARGADRIQVRVEQAGRLITLMPTLILTVTRPVADWNNDGVVDAADLDAYLADWSGHAPPTDLNEDGLIDTRDVIAFLQAWAGN